jgi:soluble lytic murein transglycosylase-like protein
MPPTCSRPTRRQPPPRYPSSSLPAIPYVTDRRPAGSWARRLRLAISIGFAVSLLAGPAVHADPMGVAGAQVAPDPIAATVVEAGRRFGIPASWLRAVMQVESGGNAQAVSSKGAMGLMQIMPETWADLRQRYGLGADPFDLHDNIIAGAAYLRELHDRYGSPGFLAAYNAGPTRYEDHIATGEPLPAETRAYVALLTPLIGTGAIDQTAAVAISVRQWTEAPLFAVHTDDQPTDTRAQDWTALAPQSEGLFVQTSRQNPQP